MLRFLLKKEILVPSLLINNFWCIWFLNAENSWLQGFEETLVLFAKKEFVELEAPKQIILFWIKNRKFASFLFEDWISFRSKIIALWNISFCFKMILNLLNEYLNYRLSSKKSLFFAKLVPQLDLCLSWRAEVLLLW